MISHQQDYLMAAIGDISSAASAGQGGEGLHSSAGRIHSPPMEHAFLLSL
jgi:hypothetical protein